MKLTLLTLLVAANSFGQTPAGLMAMPRIQFLGNTGLPLNGGCLFSYATGGSSPLATYSDSQAMSQNANPIALDSAGRVPIAVFLGASTYRIVLTNAPLSGVCGVSNFGSQIWSVDGVNAWNSSGAGSIIIATGQSLTMQAGSTSSFATNLLSDSSGTRDLGSTGDAWRNAYINNLFLSNTILESTNNAFDLGSGSLAMRELFSFTDLTNVTKNCAVSGGFLVTGSCWYWTPTVDANNSFLVLRDDAGTNTISINRKAGGVVANAIGINLHTVPGVTATWDLGCPTCGGGSALYWRNLYLSGTANTGNVIPNNSLTYDLGSGSNYWNNAYLATIHSLGDILPAPTATRNLGSPSLFWDNLYVGAISVDTGGTISVGNGSVTFGGGTLALGGGSLIIPPVGSVLDGTKTCGGGLHFNSITFSQGLATSWNCN